ncbi:Pimeloyl-ACP methyl ester carboxylesterase [bacterium A37T11]|nr:Pimeloyl-ACP methyl ester carboxylesterase [bacterium A37T11]
MKVNKILLSAPLFFLFFLIAACSSDDDSSPEPDSDYKYLVSSEEIAAVSIDEIKSRLPANFPAAAATLFVNSAVKVYKIVYQTEFPKGFMMHASGLIIVPENKTTGLTLLGFQHGTILDPKEAPSNYKPLGNQEAYMGGTVGASLAKGYMVVMPDYLGYGESSSTLHLYQHKESLASASLDMLKAAKEFADSKNLGLRKEVRLLGYSEGGYATMALHQAIEATASDQFTVEASYPGAGAYDMESTAKWVVSQNSNMAQPATTFYMWTLLVYNQYYNIGLPLTDVLQPDYAAKVATATANGNPLTAQLSDNPAELFTPGFIAAIKNGTNTAFTTALQANNVYDWKPNAPVLLLHADGDDIVPVLNAHKAEAAMKANGANVSFMSLGSGTHRESAQKYIEALLQELIK